MWVDRRKKYMAGDDKDGSERRGRGGDLVKKDEELERRKRENM